MAVHPRVRHALQKLALLTGSVIATLLFLEWALRITRIQPVIRQNPPIYRSSDVPGLSYELISGAALQAYGWTVTTNAEGFRSPSIDRSKPLVAFLGDSVTFGYGLPDHQSIPSYLQRLLTGATVLNGGVPGYNIWQQTAQFRTKIKPLHPETLVLLFVFNDMEETMGLDPEGYFLPRSTIDGAPPYRERLRRNISGPGTLHIPFKMFLQQRSALFNFAEARTKNLFFRKEGEAPVNPFDPSVPQEDLAAYGRELHLLSTEADEAGVRQKLFLIWPREVFFREARDTLRRMAEAEGFRVVDLYDVYGNYYDHLPWDGHPSAATNMRTAQTIKQALTHWGMLPSAR